MSENKALRPPPTVEWYPKQGAEALYWLDAAKTTLDLLEDEARAGWFRVSFRDREQALSLVQHAENCVRIADEMPNIMLWATDEILGGRRPIPLNEFIEKGKRSRRQFRRSMAAFRREVAGKRSTCIDGLNKYKRRQDRESLRLMEGDRSHELVYIDLIPRVGRGGGV